MKMKYYDEKSFHRIWMSVCCLFLDEQDTFFAVILLSEIKFSLGSHTMYFRFGLSSLATYTNNSALKRGVYGTYMERIWNVGFKVQYHTHLLMQHL